MSSGNRKNGEIAHPNIRCHVSSGQVIRPPQAGIDCIQAVKVLIAFKLCKYRCY